MGLWAMIQLIDPFGIPEPIVRSRPITMVVIPPSGRKTGLFQTRYDMST
jgi:hypothetical protein